MDTKLRQSLLLTLAVLFTPSLMAENQLQPDIYSVVERKLGKTLPLTENDKFSKQRP